MSTFRGFALCFVAGSITAGWAGYQFGLRQSDHASVGQHSRHRSPGPVDKNRAEVKVTSPNQMSIDEHVEKSLNLKVSPVLRAPDTEPLVLAGSLFLDSSQFAMVHTRFLGEVVKVGEVVDSREGTKRQVRAGDFVAKDQIIAVIWSKEIGEKKSDLVEALSRCKASKATMERLQTLEQGVVAGQIVRDARRQYESDLIAVDRAERTLRSWKETEAEIAEVHAEAERISRGEDAKNSRVRETWANVEIRSPLDGVVLERNISLGEIVDTNFDMFKIANVSRMGVLANIYEDDLPKLTRLSEGVRTWKLRLKAEPDSEPIMGSFEVIGHVIHPTQHTAAVVGWIENKDRRLRAGQFVTATIEVPGPGNTVLVPNSAVIDQGTIATVFVANDASPRQVEARSVVVVRRGRDFALIRKTPGPGSKEALTEDELVVTSGNLELFGVLQDQPAIATANSSH